MRYIDTQGEDYLFVLESVVSWIDKVTVYVTDSSQILRKYGKFGAIW
jgi:hypothetical protein